MTSLPDPFADAATDPFAGVDAPLDDPSQEIATEAGVPEPGAEGVQEAAALPSPDAQQAEAPPIVDREGEVVAPGPLATTPEDEPAAEPEAPVEPPQATPAEPAPAPAPAAAAVPPPRTGAKPPDRHYKLLYQTGEDPVTWTEFDLSSVPDNIGVTIVTLAEDVKEGEPARSEQWILARNNEHANKLAFAMLGRPAGGVRAFPVPRGGWKPKMIKPAAPKPERERLEIS